MCTAKGSDARPGVPRAPRLLRGRRGTMCTAKGSDVRPGVPRAPRLLRGRRGPRAPRLFAWQAWDNVSSQGVGCTPWRPSGSASFAWQEWDNVHCQGVAATGLDEPM